MGLWANYPQKANKVKAVNQYNPKHRFCVVDKGWTSAGDLTADIVVVLYSGEETDIQSISIEQFEKPITVYNLEVEDGHTYFVSDENVLVHNDCPDSDEIGNKGQYFRRGKQSSRDKWYGYNDSGFQNWWHRVGKKEWGEGDISDTVMAKMVYEYWVEIGKPKVK